MDQMTIFDTQFKYIMDASSFDSQKDGEPHTRKINKTLWSNIERLIKDGVIITCSEIVDELQDPDIRDWLSSLKCVVIDIDVLIQQNVIKIVTKNPQLINFAEARSSGSSGSSGDAFLIATAMKYNIIVITEENRNSPKKIPQVSENMGVDCINVNLLCEREGWEF